MNKHQQRTDALTLYAPAWRQLPENVRRLVNETYAARGGAERMTLDDWRDVEQELKRRLEDEYQKHQR